MIRKARTDDFDAIYSIINKAAAAYKGVIPDDRWHDPYMSRAELQEQIDAGVMFSCYCEDEKVLGVMGIQDVKDVFLIRHAYVHPDSQDKGIGTALLRNLAGSAEKPVLIGTWKAATWGHQILSQERFQPCLAGGKRSPAAKVLAHSGEAS